MSRRTGVMFVLTVDSEADNQWSHGIPLATENVRYWEPFQSLCRRHGVRPTYLVTSEILSDSLAQSLLKSWAQRHEVEIGAHLHPWTTPPFVDAPGLRFNDPSHAFISELPQELARAKLENLTDEIRVRLGIRPVSFRAGRFGLNLGCARSLAQLGYVVDSSVTPLKSWRKMPGLPGGPGGPDFSQQTARPFLIQGTGDPGLTEIPVTIIPTYSLLRRFPPLLDLYRSLPAKALRRLLLRRWLSPQPAELNPAFTDFRLRDLQSAFGHQSEDAGVAVMMLHSSELMPGGSPSRATEASVRDLLMNLDRFMGLVLSRGAEPTTLTEAALRLGACGALAQRPL